MSRWVNHKEFKNPTIWVNAPKRLYKIQTGQGDFIIKSEYLDYKKVIKELSKKGYNDINICCLGFIK